MKAHCGGCSIPVAKITSQLAHKHSPGQLAAGFPSLSHQLIAKGSLSPAASVTVNQTGNVQCPWLTSDTKLSAVHSAGKAQSGALSGPVLGMRQTSYDV